MTGPRPTREWGVLLKARVPPDEPEPTPGQLDAMLAALPGDARRLTGGGRDFTAAWWVEADDAGSATRLAAATLRRCAAAVGIGTLSFVRSHAASAEGRAPTMELTDQDVATPGRWAVDVKVATPLDQGRATRELLERVRSAMVDADARVTLHGDLEKFLLDDGSGFTLRFRTTADEPEDAMRAARSEVRAALASAGLGDALIVRLKAWQPAALRGDTFPGAADHEPQSTGELR